MSSRRKSSSISSIASLSLETSPRHSFQPLLEPPLPSPSLPSLIPRHGKRLNASRHQTVLLVLASLCGLSLLAWFALAFLQSKKPVYDIQYLSHDGKVLDLSSNDPLPLDPSAVVATDKNGRLRWTILIPPALGFPLKPSQYSQICLQSGRTAMQVVDSNRGGGVLGDAGRIGYNHVDKDFVDIEEAQQLGLVPGKLARWNLRLKGGQKEQDSMGEDLDDIQGGDRGNICTRSLTYVMGATDAGFGVTLMGLWMSYGLAKKEGRAFFIDDTTWAFGKYTTFFQPPPTPDCLPPPPTHRLPCPHHVKHLVVSAATTSWTFGHAFNERFQNAHKIEVFRQKPIFAFLRTGYEALFHLNSPDHDYVTKRSEELNTQIRDAEGLVVGVHVRHGDRHPWEYQYQKSYIPLEKYLNAANDFILPSFTDHGNASASKDFIQASTSKIIVASDDPMVYLSDEFSHALRAQNQMQLASKAALDAASAGSQAPQGDKFVEENVGWEGGFFQDMFWDLGIPSGLSKHSGSDGGLHGEEARVPEVAVQLRALVGKAYMLDLAVLGKADRIVCTASSAGCRLLAVMMGWDEAIKKQRWKNVDGAFGWTGIVW